MKKQIDQLIDTDITDNTSSELSKWFLWTKEYGSSGHPIKNCYSGKSSIAHPPLMVKVWTPGYLSSAHDGHTEYVVCKDFLPALFMGAVPNPTPNIVMCTCGGHLTET